MFVSLLVADVLLPVVFVCLFVEFLVVVFGSE